MTSTNDIFLLKNNVYWVESEPGDMTHYSFIVCMLSSDVFTFAPYNSTFNFPQRLNWREVKSLDKEQLTAMANDLKCNPYTLKECIRVMKLLRRNIT